MKTPKYLAIFLFIIQLQFGYSQNTYDFIPSEFIQLSDEQLNTMNIMIKPDIMLFNDKGDRLGMDQMSLMANPEFRPIFYADNNGNIKAVVFENKIDHPILVEQNPEEVFEKGEYALDFLVTDLNGNSIKLSELRGKIVVLNFWFIKCSPCVMEMPDLNELSAMYDPKNVVFLAITFDNKDLVEQFLTTTQFDYTIAANAMDAINIYGVRSFPTNMVINKEGQIVLKEIGYRLNMKEVLVTAINKLL
jgi:thiol-disulfide isomerase/thioredoxin